MADFSKAEEKEREVITRLMKILKPKSCIMSEIGSYSPWDFIISYGIGKSMLGEMKCLTCDSSKYNRMLLEVKKAKELIYSAYKQGKIKNSPIYCMHYTDDVVRILKLTPELLIFYQPEWININGRNKSVYFIPITEAHNFNL